MDTFDNPYFRINRLLLLYSGLWPTQPPFKRKILLLCIIFGTLIVSLPQYAYLMRHVRGLKGIYDVLPSISGGSMSFAKVIGFNYKFKKFKVLIRHVRSDWHYLAQDEDARILMEYVKRGRLFTLVYAVFLATGATAYMTAPFTMPILNIILASNITTAKKLPLPCEFFVDTERYYYALLGILNMGGVSCVMTVLSTDSIYVMLLQHVCGMLAILSHRLENTAMTRSKSVRVDRNRAFDSDKDVRRLIKCVQLQLRIERSIRLIESTFAICLVVDMGIGIFLQCSSCVMIVARTDTTETLENIPLLLLQSTRIFFNSLVGQMLIDHSTQVPIAAYNGTWYQSSLEARRMLLFLIAKCRKSYHLTIAKLYTISLEGYSTVMRTSASYITLMISLQSDDA